MVADASMVRAWDFSGAEEIQQRLDALRLQRDAQRSERRERGRYAGRRLQPRFPPQLDSSEEEDDEHTCGIRPQDGVDPRDTPCAARDDTRASRFSTGAENSHQNTGPSSIPVPVSRGAASAAWDSQQCMAPGSRASWSGDSGAPGKEAMSRSLPAQLGSSGSGARQIRPLPPPLVRASGCCAEAEAARISRMTSWDIQRPRRSSAEGVKAAG